MKPTVVSILYNWAIGAWTAQVGGMIVDPNKNKRDLTQQWRATLGFNWEHWGLVGRLRVHRKTGELEAEIPFGKILARSLA